MSRRTERKSEERRNRTESVMQADPPVQTRRTGGKPYLLGIALVAALVMLIVGAIQSGQGNSLPQSPGAPSTANNSGSLPVVGDLFPNGPVDVDGTVVDAQSGLPVAGARVEAAGKTATADAEGKFRLEALPKDSSLSIAAAGYQPRSATAGNGSPRVELQPLAFEGTVRDAYLDKPVAGAVVSASGRSVVADAEGKFRLLAVPEGTTLAVEAEGYARGEASAKSDAPLLVALRPNVISGRVTHAGTDKPLEGATVSIGTASASTDAEGRYRLAGIPAEGKLVADAPGYDKVELPLPKATAQDFQLKDFTIKAAYLTHDAVGYKPMREMVLDLIDKTELNAVVIDIKDDDGSIAYESAVPLAKAIGALKRTTIPDPEGFVAGLKRRGIYTIARIITFKDDLLNENGAGAGVDVGLKDSRTGRPWKDKSQGLGWVDPFRTEAWDYNIAIAKEAALKGFDEIQFDYIRFPADPAVQYVTFSKPNTTENRVAAISGFLARARRELKPLGVTIAVDVFGYASWQQDNVNLPLGQNVEEMAKHVDFISPMNYPSLFWYGLPTTPSYQPAEDYPYEIVRLSVEKARERIAGTGAKIRTWIQYYNGSNRRYTANDLIAQEKGAMDGGSLGWMLWEPFVEYGKGGLAEE